MSPPTDSHARDVEHTPETEARLAEMCDVMRDLRWRRGKSGPEYAERWGLSVTRVEHLASEAWKRVAAELDAVQAKATIGTLLERVALEAYEDSRTAQMLVTENGTRQESPNAYRRIVVDAGKTLADVLGAKAPTKTELTGKSGAPLQLLGVDISSLSDEQLDALRATNDPRSVGIPAVSGPARGTGDGASPSDEGEGAT